MNPRALRAALEGVNALTLGAAYVALREDPTKGAIVGVGELAAWLDTDLDVARAVLEELIEERRLTGGPRPEGAFEVWTAPRILEDCPWSP